MLLPRTVFETEMETIVVDQLRTLLSQEQRYDLPDYLHAITPGDSGSVSAMEVDRIRQHMEEDPSAKPIHSREGHVESNGRIMNDGILCLSDIQKQKIHWREKICEWSYQGECFGRTYEQLTVSGQESSGC